MLKGSEYQELVKLIKTVRIDRRPVNGDAKRLEELESKALKQQITYAKCDAKYPALALHMQKAAREV